MSDIVTLNGYKIKDEKAIRSYETIAQMKADTKLKEGYHVKTKGYYEVNDGGHGEYVIVDDDTLVEDNGYIHILNNDLRAKLIINNYVTPEQFGCYGDEEHDDTINFQNMLNKVLNIKLNENKKYKISNTLTFRTNTKLIGTGQNSQIISYINDDSPIFYNNENVSHFIFQDFYINAKDNSCYGFIITNPYDNCIIKNIYFDNFGLSCLKIGRVDKISQTLLIDNCMVYMSSSFSNLNSPIFHFIKCYESNILNNKLLNRQTNYNDSPCLLLENVYDNNIQGNSFTCSNDCGIKITGTDCRQNRIISNTYELLEGEYSIKLDGTTTDAIQFTMILEAFTYYSAPNKIYCHNETNGLFIGMESTGGRRNLILNVNDSNVVNAYGNCTITSEAGNLCTSGFYLRDYTSTPKYKIYSDSSESVDYGLKITDRTNSNFEYRFKPHHFGSTKPGGKILLISPDGTKTKYLGINDSGEIYLSNYDYE